MLGKVPPDLLADLVLGRTGAADPRVVQGPAYGEDSAAIRLGDEDGGDGDLLVVNPDPISLAVGRIGTLGVAVACNDLAASGATPAWLTVVIFLPGAETAEESLDEITRQLDREARRLDVSIVGGHTEYSPALADPLLVLNAFGLAERYVPTSGARPGDRLLLTKAAGIEGTAILATDFRDLVGESVPADVIERAATFYDDVSVLPEAAVLTERANAMHDPTEGGLVDGLLEMATAANVALDVDPDAVPVREETRQLCRAAGVDPLRIFGSGALVASVPDGAVGDVTRRLDERGITNTVVGTVRETDEPHLVLGEETVTEPIRDEMYGLWEDG